MDIVTVSQRKEREAARRVIERLRGLGEEFGGVASLHRVRLGRDRFDAPRQHALGVRCGTARTLADRLVTEIKVLKEIIDGD